MKFSNKIRFGLVAVATIIAGWQLHRHVRQNRELAEVQAQLQDQQQELETRREALADAERKNNEVAETERRAGNDTLLTLMRERAAATKTTSETAQQSPKVEDAVANVLDSPAQREIDRQATRDAVRADTHLFFTLTHLSPEQIEQFIDLKVEMEERKANRRSALLRGQMDLADALHQRDQDQSEGDQRRSAIIGAEAEKFYESIADEMRDNEAKRLIGAIQGNMGDNRLNEEQSNRLRSLIKTEIVSAPLDDTDLFRSADDWEQYFAGHQQNVFDAAAAFLSPQQLETIKGLAALDLAQKKDQMLSKKKSLGIK